LGAGGILQTVQRNEITQMGGLRKYLPITHITFLIACLAIAGIPPFSVFFSKDEILAAAFHHDKLIFVTLWIVAGLTAFYMFRLYFTVFWGKEREYEHKPHESSWIMLLPLVVLAIFTCVTGFIPFSKFVSSDNLGFAAHIDWAIAASGVSVALIGITTDNILYRKYNSKPETIALKAGSYYKTVLNKFYMDELWMFVTKSVIFKYISVPIAWFDKHIVDGMINQTGKQTENASSSIKGLQSGKVQFYAIVFVLGVLLITVLSLFV